jgi:hypothetical protein
MSETERDIPEIGVDELDSLMRGDAVTLLDRSNRPVERD